MRSDLAALTPPLVMAVAFIAGVVALLRREMAPRRRGQMTPPDENESTADPHSGIAPLSYAHLPHGRQNVDGGDGSSGNSANSEASRSDASDLLGRGDDRVIRRAPDDRPSSSGA